MVSIVGSVGAVFIQFIYPPLLHNKFFKTKNSFKIKFFNYLIQAIGIIGGILGIYYTLEKMNNWLYFIFLNYIILIDNKLLYQTI